MATHDSTGTSRGSTQPIVAELIRDEIANWFGQQHPYPDVKESISAEALEGMLNRVADRAFTAGSTGAVSPDLDGRLIEAGVHIDGVSAALKMFVDHVQHSRDVLAADLMGAFDVTLAGILSGVKSTLTEAHSALTSK